jgi:hypothetical protein
MTQCKHKALAAEQPPSGVAYTLCIFDDGHGGKHSCLKGKSSDGYCVLRDGHRGTCVVRLYDFGSNAVST